jgi:hypothetical protein
MDMSEAEWLFSIGLVCSGLILGWIAWILKYRLSPKPEAQKQLPAPKPVKPKRTYKPTSYIIDEDGPSRRGKPSCYARVRIYEDGRTRIIVTCSHVAPPAEAWINGRSYKLVCKSYLKESSSVELPEPPFKIGADGEIVDGSSFHAGTFELTYDKRDLERSVSDLFAGIIGITLVAAVGGKEAGKAAGQAWTRDSNERQLKHRKAIRIAAKN